MNLACIIPLSRNVPDDILYYFSTFDLKKGDLVEIPFRKKIILGVVHESHKENDIKSMVKSLPYQLKNVHRVLRGHEDIISSLYHASLSKAQNVQMPLRGILFKMLPKNFLVVLQEEAIISANTTQQDLETLGRTKRRATTYVLNNTQSRRYEIYASHAREAFAKKKSLVCVFPSRAHIDAATSLISKGLHGDPLLFHGEISQKKQQGQYRQLLLEPLTPRLILTTPSFAAITLANADTIVIDSEAHEAYKARFPYSFNYDDVLERLAERMGVTAIRAESIARSDTTKRLLEKSIETIESLFHFPKKLNIVNREETDKSSEVFMGKTLSILKESYSLDKKILIFAPRKGYATSTSCSDCGSSVRCSECNMPVRYRSKDQSTKSYSRKVFSCYNCQHEQKAYDSCASCGGHRLATLGFGIERIAETLEKKGLVSYEVISGDTHTTYPSTKKALLEFKLGNKNILLATKKVLPLLSEDDFEDVFILSSEALLYTHSYRSHMDSLRLLYKLADVGKKNMIQAAGEDSFIHTIGTSRNFKPLIDQEQSLRKTLSMPPYAIHIKLFLAIPTLETEHMQKILKSASTFAGKYSKLFKTTIKKTQKKIPASPYQKKTSKTAERENKRPLLIQNTILIIESIIPRENWSEKEDIYKDILEIRSHVNHLGHNQELSVDMY